MAQAEPRPLSYFGCEPPAEVAQLIEAICRDGPLTPGVSRLVAAALRREADPAIGRLLPALHGSPAAGQLPGDLRDGVTAAWRRATARFLYLVSLEEGLTRALLTAGIRPVFLKGYGLASTAYRHPAQRPMGDLDVAVPPHQVDAADAVLGRLGFLPQPGLRLNGPGLRHARSYRHRAGGDAVDLHGHILLAAPWDEVTAGFHARAVPLGLAGAATLTPEDHLVHACLHGYGETVLVGSWRWMLDALFILDRSGSRFDWKAFEDCAGELRAEAVLAAALAYLATRFGAAVPDPVLARLASVRRPADERYFRASGHLPETLWQRRAFSLIQWRRLSRSQWLDPLAFVRWARARRQASDRVAVSRKQALGAALRRATLPGPDEP